MGKNIPHKDERVYEGCGTDEVQACVRGIPLNVQCVGLWCHSALVDFVWVWLLGDVPTIGRMILQASCFVAKGMLRLLLDKSKVGAAIS